MELRPEFAVCRIAPCFAVRSVRAFRAVQAIQGVRAVVRPIVLCAPCMVLFPLDDTRFSLLFTALLTTVTVRFAAILAILARSVAARLSVCVNASRPGADGLSCEIGDWGFGKVDDAGEAGLAPGRPRSFGAVGEFSDSELGVRENGSPARFPERAEPLGTGGKPSETARRDRSAAMRSSACDGWGKRNS
jgi:hypothetical protein